MRCVLLRRQSRPGWQSIVATHVEIEALSPRLPFNLKVSNIQIIQMISFPHAFSAFLMRYDRLEVANLSQGSS